MRNGGIQTISQKVILESPTLTNHNSIFTLRELLDAMSLAEKVLESFDYPNTEPKLSKLEGGN